MQVWMVGSALGWWDGGEMGMGFKWKEEKERKKKRTNTTTP